MTLTAEDLADLAAAIDDLWNDSGEPVELPPAEEAKTVDGEPIYLELEWRPK